MCVSKINTVVTLKCRWIVVCACVCACPHCSHPTCFPPRIAQETLFLAVNLLDRFLAAQKVYAKELELVAGCCMFIAAKYEETVPPLIVELLYYMDEVCRGHH